MKKKTNTTIKKKVAVKKETERPLLSNTYYDLKDMRLKPFSENYLNNLAEESIQLALKDETILTTAAIFHKLGFSKAKWHEWIKKNEKVAEANSIILEIVGSRREHGSLTKKLSESLVSRSMALFDPEWKALEEWRAKMKSESGPTTSSVTLQIIDESGINKSDDENG